MAYSVRHGKLRAQYNINYMRNVEQEMTVQTVLTQDQFFYAFLDEVGDEGLPNRGTKYFALSGCCFIGAIDQKGLNEEWHKLRVDVFKLPPTSSYHSKKHFPKLRSEGIQRILQFVDRHPVKFLAASVDAGMPIDQLDRDKYFQVLNACINSLSDSADELFDASVKRDEWYLEHSGRMSPRMMTATTCPKYSRAEEHGGLYFLKDSHDPAIEIADMINYAVGQCLAQNKNSMYGEVCNAVFHPYRGKWTMLGPILGPFHIAP